MDSYFGDACDDVIGKWYCFIG